MQGCHGGVLLMLCNFGCHGGLKGPPARIVNNAQKFQLFWGLTVGRVPTFGHGSNFFGFKFLVRFQFFGYGFQFFV